MRKNPHICSFHDVLTIQLNFKNSEIKIKWLRLQLDSNPHSLGFEATEHLHNRMRTAENVFNYHPLAILRQSLLRVAIPYQL